MGWETQAHFAPRRTGPTAAPRRSREWQSCAVVHMALRIQNPSDDETWRQPLYSPAAHVADRRSPKAGTALKRSTEDMARQAVLPLPMKHSTEDRKMRSTTRKETGDHSSDGGRGYWRNVGLTGVAVVLAATLGGCSSEDSETPQGAAGSASRVRLGKADVPGTCATTGGSNYCGGKSNSSCWCDEQCSNYGDCCADVQAVCNKGASCSVILCGPGQVCQNTDPTCTGADCLGECKALATCATLLCGPGTVCETETGCTGSACAGKCVALATCATLLCGPGTVCATDPTCIGANCAAKCVPEQELKKSCVGRCGGSSEDGSCYCDTACVTYKDCCENYAAACP